MAKTSGKKRSHRKPGLFQRLEALYARMGEDYARVAESVGLTCEGCPENCCVSYFKHHTFVEWEYLWRGMLELPEEKRAVYLQRAETAKMQADQLLASGIRPSVMCPLNDDGKCGLYTHRLMICRMHGTAHRIVRPDGSAMDAPGCFRFMERVESQEQFPVLDRSPLYRELAELEMEFQKRKGVKNVRFAMTISEMLVAGPPKFK